MENIISKEDFEIIKKTTQDFFKKTTFDIKTKFFPVKDEVIYIKLDATEPQILIGERGQTLSEIQHLLKAILKKKIQKSFYIDLDINDYKEKKNEYLKDLAKLTADEVALLKKEKMLQPMSSYERRIIHLELAGRTDVITESMGEEPERRVVIKPQP